MTRTGFTPVAASATLVKGLPIEGRFDLARRAVQQTRTQPRLQRLGRMGGRGARQVQCRGGFSEAAQFNDAVEQEQSVKTVHVGRLSRLME